MPEKKSKNLKQKLRQLAGIAYERELKTASEALLKDFNRWENNAIDVYELNDLIHKFHHGISRELYNRYTGNEMICTFGVSSALRRGILCREEVGDEVFVYLEGKV